MEDDLALCRLYQVVLERTGHEVALANTGEAGLDAARQNQPGLVILDLVLPAMPGFQVAQCLRRDGVLDNAPLILTTGMGQEDTEAVAAFLGAHGVLIKPFRIGSIKAVVQTALNTAAGQSSPESAPGSDNFNRPRSGQSAVSPPRKPGQTPRRRWPSA